MSLIQKEGMGMTEKSRLGLGKLCPKCGGVNWSYLVSERWGFTEQDAIIYKTGEIPVGRAHVMMTCGTYLGGGSFCDQRFDVELTLEEFAAFLEEFGLHPNERYAEP